MNDKKLIQKTSSLKKNIEDLLDKYRKETGFERVSIETHSEYMEMKDGSFETMNTIVNLIIIQ